MVFVSFAQPVNSVLDFFGAAGGASSSTQLEPRLRQMHIGALEC